MQDDRNCGCNNGIFGGCGCNGCDNTILFFIIVFLLTLDVAVDRTYNSK